MQNPKAFRLPTHVLPSRYDVHLDARLDRDDFRGRVFTDITVTEPTPEIILHGRDLQIESARVSVGGKPMDAQVTLQEDRETLTLRFPHSVPAGDGFLEIAFQGKVSISMEGLYRARDGPEMCLATQAQETDARGIFPCFDEPAFKARIAWRITTDPTAVVLTNGKHVRTERRGDGVTWTFEETRPISSYLFAFCIGDFAATPEERVNGVPLRVWGMRGKENLGTFALRFTGRLLPWFEDYFGVPYPYGKYDQVAVPGFSAGAMENVGLVLFRQAYLLMNPATASWKDEQNIARVVAHEFAHMWFGNLVTMQWWDEIWLNESFAEWMAHKAVHALAPEYRIWDRQQTDKASALATDALESTHPIYQPVETPEQATEMFDLITYQKGAATMRMLEHYLGEEAFRAGLRTYMKEFAEKNARGADLWRHLHAASKEPVDRIMGAWVLTPGHPVVRVSLEGNLRNPKIRLTQRRFLLNPRPTVSLEAVWPVPLVLRYADAAGVHERRHLLTEKEATLPVPVEGELRWLTANADGVGVYRQDFDETLLRLLLANASALTPAEQASLLDDQWGLVRNGTHPVSRFLAVADVLSGSRDHAVLERLVAHLRGLEDMLAEAGDAAALHGFRGWVVRTLAPQLHQVGFVPHAGERREAAVRRVALLEAVAAIGRDPRAVEECVRLADLEAEDPRAVNPDLASLAVAVAAKFGDRARQDAHVRIYQARKAAGAAPQETDRYLYSFPAFEEPALVQRVFHLMDEKVIPQEAVGPLLRWMFAKRHAQVPAWERLKGSWGDIRARLGDLWTGVLVEASGNLPGTHRKDVVGFFEANLKGVAEQSYRRALESMDQRTEFRERVRGDLVAWFRRVGA
ncbi:MAG TPA: M1 family metallopeptidase [Candidatus Thermoplasmatota archaeon]|nr:M1 family metallopeptidase [Candidatus Thermoplasmatota archaeon]